VGDNGKETATAKKQQTVEHSNVEPQKAEVQMRDSGSAFHHSAVRMFECSAVRFFLAVDHSGETPPGNPVAHH
jgi:hypothetical protein